MIRIVSHSWMSRPWQRGECNGLCDDCWMETSGKSRERENVKLRTGTKQEHREPESNTRRNKTTAGKHTNDLTKDKSKHSTYVYSSTNELQVYWIIGSSAEQRCLSNERCQTRDKETDKTNRNERTNLWTMTVPLLLRAPPGAIRGTYPSIVIIDKRVIQYVPCGNPTSLLRTVTFPVHQILESASPPSRVQNTFDRINGFPIYETRRWGNRSRRINRGMKNRF